MKVRRGVYLLGGMAVIVSALVLTFALMGVGVFARSAHAGRPLVYASASSRQSLGALVRGQFVELVVCTRACEAAVTTYIDARLATALGFTGVTPRENYAVGSKTIRLRANATTRVVVPLNADARKRLAKVGKPFQLVGRVLATPNTGSKKREASLWIVTVIA